MFGNEWDLRNLMYDVCVLRRTVESVSLMIIIRVKVAS